MAWCPSPPYGLFWPCRFWMYAALRCGGRLTKACSATISCCSCCFRCVSCALAATILEVQFLFVLPGGRPRRAPPFFFSPPTSVEAVPGSLPAVSPAEVDCGPSTPASRPRLAPMVCLEKPPPASASAVSRSFFAISWMLSHPWLNTEFGSVTTGPFPTWIFPPTSKLLFAATLAFTTCSAKLETLPAKVAVSQSASAPMVRARYRSFFRNKRVSHVLLSRSNAESEWNVRHAWHSREAWPWYPTALAPACAGHVNGSRLLSMGCFRLFSHPSTRHNPLCFAGWCG
mmetsp:Transcript_12729/g.47628  ORF Transcript_12729/g.47628 Transcript_12729/m.47628 type:complete len:286 (+) Transcript_12729:622-1479(+)